MTSETIQHIPLTRIQPHPANRRVGGFNQVKLEQLAESIRAVGVQQPAVVRPLADGGYQLVAGERRWRASKIAEQDTLPCIIRDLDDATALRIQLVENLQREDVHPLDEADGYEELRSKSGLSPDQIASEVGRSVSYVYQRLKLLSLIPEIRTFLAENKISASVAVLLARLPESQQKLVMKAQIQEYQLVRGVSAHDVDNWIRQNLLLDLTKVAWKLSDANLVKRAGACSACPKRTGAEAALFEDIKGDHCTDSACFKLKQAAIVKKNIESLKGTEHLVVRVGYSGGGPNIEGALNSWEYKVCRKQDPGAKRAVVINGQSAGRLIFAQKMDRDAERTAWQATHEEDPAKKAARERKEKREAAHRETNRKLFGLIMSACATSGYQTKLLRALAKEAAQDADLGELDAWYGWQPKEGIEDELEAWEATTVEALDAMDQNQLLAFLLACRIEHALDVYQWDEPITRQLEPYLKLYQIDGEAIRTEVYAAAAVPLEDPEDEDDDDEFDGLGEEKYGACRVCGCTDDDCSQCVAKTGKPCTWVDETHTLCSACVAEAESDDAENEEAER